MLSFIPQKVATVMTIKRRQAGSTHLLQPKRKKNDNDKKTNDNNKNDKHSKSNETK
jgi:hypothetical protein